MECDMEAEEPSPEEIVLFEQAMANVAAPQKQPRLIAITDEINLAMLDHVSGRLIDLQTESTVDPIEVRLASPGGDHMAALGIIDMLDTAEASIITTVYGSADSAASYIFQSGKKRYIAKSGSVHIHTIRAMIQQAVIDVEAAEELLRDLTEKQRYLNRMLSRRSTLSTAEIRELSRKETTFSAREVIKNGLADEVISKRVRAKLNRITFQSVGK